MIRPHDLRHTHATLALRAGIHPKVVSERLGHAEHLDHPGHLFARHPGHAGRGCRKVSRSSSLLPDSDSAASHGRLRVAGWVWMRRSRGGACTAGPAPVSCGGLPLFREELAARSAAIRRARAGRRMKRASDRVVARRLFRPRAGGRANVGRDDGAARRVLRPHRERRRDRGELRGGDAASRARRGVPGRR